MYNTANSMLWTPPKNQVHSWKNEWGQHYHKAVWQRERSNIGLREESNAPFFALELQVLLLFISDKSTVWNMKANVFLATFQKVFIRATVRSLEGLKHYSRRKVLLDITDISIITRSLFLLLSESLFFMKNNTFTMYEYRWIFTHRAVSRYI
jgi:hypothetical protein